MPIDPFKGNSPGLTSPLTTLTAVTPNDSADLVATSKAIYVGVSGDVKLTDADGNVTTLTSLAAGVFHPVRAARIWATGTSATNIVAGY